jgi:hypothetical protein
MVRKPWSAARPSREIDLDFVEALLIEQNRAARAENLRLQPPLAAPGAAVDMDRAGDGAGQAKQRARAVESLDRAPPALVRPVGVGLRHLAEYARGAPEQRRDQDQGTAKS